MTEKTPQAAKIIKKKSFNLNNSAIAGRNALKSRRSAMKTPLAEQHACHFEIYKI
jgi:hypothetical protein